MPALENFSQCSQPVFLVRWGDDLSSSSRGQIEIQMLIEQIGRAEIIRKMTVPRLFAVGCHERIFDSLAFVPGTVYSSVVTGILPT